MDETKELMPVKKNFLTELYQNAEGRVAPPLLLYFLGVPGGICLLLWLFIWRGK